MNTDTGPLLRLRVFYWRKRLVAWMIGLPVIYEVFAHVIAKHLDPFL